MACGEAAGQDASAVQARRLMRNGAATVQVHAAQQSSSHSYNYYACAHVHTQAARRARPAHTTRACNLRRGLQPPRVDVHMRMPHHAPQAAAGASEGPQAQPMAYIRAWHLQFCTCSLASVP
jgi:hypothetical protein